MQQIIEKLPDPLEKFFVDRHAQTEDYHCMLQNGIVRILCIRGDEGVGKTFLLERLKADRVGSNCLIAKIDFSIQSNHEADQLEILQSITSQMSGIMNNTTIPTKQPSIPSANLAANRDINVSGKVVGGHEITINVNQKTPSAPKVTLNGFMRLATRLGLSHLLQQVDKSATIEKPTLTDINLTVNNELSKLDRADLVDKLTKRLLDGIQGLDDEQYAILFLDNFEKASSNVRDWLLTLFDRFWTDEIKKLIVVMTGQCEFELDETLYYFVLHKHVLSGFDEETARQYCQRRGVDPDVVLKDFQDRNNISPTKLFLKVTQYDVIRQRQIRGSHATS